MKLPDEKRDVKDGVVYRYSAEWTRSLESEQHWRLYWNQQNLMKNRLVPGDRILEIGVGSGFAANYLKAKGIQVETVDIDPEKKPDLIANIIEFTPQSEYDCILAYEVFEHIPYTKFVETVSRLAPKCRKYLFMSVPQCAAKTYTLFSLGLFNRGPWNLRFSRPGSELMKNAYHFWEIGYQDITLNSLEQDVSRHGFQIEQRTLAFSRYFLAFRKIHPATK